MPVSAPRSSDVAHDRTSVRESPLRRPPGGPRRVNVVVVATHNLMHAIRLPALIRHYLALRDQRGLDLLCLQEDPFLTGETDLPSDRIAAALGPDYHVVRD